MKEKHENNDQVEAPSSPLEQFLLKKQEEKEALQKLLKALEEEQEKQKNRININK